MYRTPMAILLFNFQLAIYNNDSLCSSIKRLTNTKQTNHKLAQRLKIFPSVEVSPNLVTLDYPHTMLCSNFNFAIVLLKCKQHLDCICN